MSGNNLLMNPVDPSQPFIAFEVNGKMDSLSPAELYGYYKVGYTPVPFVSEAHRQTVLPLLKKARLYYEQSAPESPKRGRLLNRNRLLRIPPAGAGSVPDYLYLKSILIHAVPQIGVFASRHLPKGSWVGNYAGQLLPPDYPTRSLHAMQFSDPYAGINLKIDSKDWGNHTRFCNHSYQPNVIRKLVFCQGMYHVILYTTRIVEPQEQLLYDYGQSYWQNLGVEPTPL